MCVFYENKHRDKKTQTQFSYYVPLYFYYLNGNLTYIGLY